MTKARLALAAIGLGYFMTIIDATVVNVALADMRSQLHASVNGVQWVIVAYTLAFASLLLTAGTLGRRYGNRRIYVLGLAWFTLCSLLCGLAPNLISLAVARVLQGVGAALLVPSSLGLIADVFSNPAERAKATGLWGAIAGIGAGSGPIIGGLLVNSLSWRSIFLVNIPIGALALFLSLKYIERSRDDSEAQLDPPGQLLSVLGFGALTLACLQAKVWGFVSPGILGAAVLGIVALMVWMWVEKHASHPMVRLALFRNTSFSTGNLVGLLNNFGFYGQLFVMSLYFQQVRHFSALVTGLALLPQMGVIFIASFLSGKIAAAKGVRLPMIAGLLVGTAGFAAQTLITAQTPYWFIAAVLVCSGFGMAFTMPAMTIAVMSHAPEGSGGVASGVLNACRQLGGSFGVAILGGLVGGAAFIPGLRSGMILAAAAFLVSALCTVRYVHNPQQAA